jgi:hypothetical protein
MPATDANKAKALCGKWMPRKMTACALCHTCNIALGHIERRYAMARAYLDNPPVRLLNAA